MPKNKCFGVCVPIKGHTAEHSAIFSLPGTDNVQVMFKISTIDARNETHFDSSWIKLSEYFAP